MTDAAHRLSDAEVEERKHLLREWGVRPKATASVIPFDHPTRKPLGLRPIIEPGDEPERGDDHTPGRGELYAHEIVAKAVAGMSAETRAEVATVEMVFELCEMPLAAALSGDDTLNDKIKALAREVEAIKAEHRNELAELKLAHGALVNENQSLRLILENLRITQRGERGIDGDRGPPGRDGVQAPAGPRGERGERGPPAAMIAAWQVDAERFLVTPVYTTGERGPPICLEPAFQAYDTATNGSDDDGA